MLFECNSCSPSWGFRLQDLGFGVSGFSALDFRFEVSVFRYNYSGVKVSVSVFFFLTPGTGNLIPSFWRLSKIPSEAKRSAGTLKPRSLLFVTLKIWLDLSS